MRVDDPALVDDTIAALLAVRDPHGGPAISAIHRRETVFTGPHVDRAPELLVELADESIDVHDGFHAPAPWVSRAEVPWGTHRVDGIVAVHGASMRTTSGDAQDVAPTVLDLLGLEVAGLDGRSLVDGTDAHRIVAAVDAVPDASGYSEEEETAVLEHLRGLGYVD